MDRRTSYAFNCDFLVCKWRLNIHLRAVLWSCALSNRRFPCVFLSGRETGVGASRKDAISRRRFLHGKTGRRGELSPRYRLSRQGDRRSRAPSFGRHRYHSRRRWVSSHLSFSLLFTPTPLRSHRREALRSCSAARRAFCNIPAALRISTFQRLQTRADFTTFSILFMIRYITLLVSYKRLPIVK